MLAMCVCALLIEHVNFTGQDSLAQFSLFDLIRTDEPCLYLVLLFNRVPITYLFLPHIFSIALSHLES